MYDTRSDHSKCLRCLARPTVVHPYEGESVSVAAESWAAASRSLPAGWPHPRTPIQGERSERGVRYLGGDERGPTVGRTNLYMSSLAINHGAGSTKIEGELLDYNLTLYFAVSLVSFRKNCLSPVLFVYQKIQG